MRLLFLAVCLFLSVTTSAQDKANNKQDTSLADVYSYVAWMPVAGYDFMEFFTKNFQYPDTALKSGFVGRVIVKFIVNEDGTISNCQVIKGHEIEGELLRVMNKMPKWKPGKQDGKPVR